jgi:competence protein ComEC
LLSGLTIGDTSGVDDETAEAFRRSGLAHLVAVSGSNVAMVLAAIAIVTIKLPLPVRGGVALGALWFYVAVVGPEPSVLRAAAMGVVGLVAYVMGRQAASLNSLGIALIVVLVAKPDLLFSIGLHLSAAATLGIVVWAAPIERALRRLPALLRAPVAITLSAQIAVAPLLIITFEELSLVAPVANVLAAPAVPPATVLGLTGGVAGLIFGPLGRAIGSAAGPFAQWILWVAHETAGWSWASMAVSPSWGVVLAIPVGGAAVAGAVIRAGR